LAQITASSAKSAKFGCIDAGISYAGLAKDYQERAAKLAHGALPDLATHLTSVLPRLPDLPIRPMTRRPPAAACSL
jgi:hypothetical protein